MNTLTNMLRLVKLHYFLSAMGSAPILPFLSVVGMQFGFSGYLIGLISAITNVSLQILMPFLGRLIDSFPSNKITILTFLYGIQLIFYYLIRFTPASSSWSNSIQSVCNQGPKDQVMVVTEIDPCVPEKFQNAQFDSILCTYTCSSPTNNLYQFQGSFKGSDVSFNDSNLSFVVDTIQDCRSNLWCQAQCQDREVTRVLNKPSNDLTVGFWIYLILNIIGGICAGGTSSMQDVICQEMVKGTGQSFGQQRVYASIGWGIAAICSGYLIDYVSADSLLYDYTVGFNLMLVFRLLDLWVLTQLKTSQKTKITKKDETVATSMTSILWSQTRMTFLVFCAIFGLCNGFLAFQFVLMENLGTSTDCQARKALKFMQGLVLALNAVGEVPIFVLSNGIIRRLGEKVVLQLVTLIFALRFLYYGLITSPWQILWFESLGGVSIALFYPAMVSGVDKLSPKESRATFQALAYTAVFGVGYSLGSYIGGIMLESVGSSLMYHQFGVWTMLALVPTFVMPKF